MTESRTYIKDLILNIECDFPVNNWKANNIHLWPYLRIKLFFYLIKTLEVKPENYVLQDNQFKKKAILKQVKRALGIKFRQVQKIIAYYSWKNKLEPKDIIFVGADSHRVDYRGARFNRYFDVLIEKNNWLLNSIYFEYASKFDNQYNPKNVLKFKEALNGFQILKKKKEIIFSLDGYPEFLSYLESQTIFNEFVKTYSVGKLTTWCQNIFFSKKEFFTVILKKIKPKKIAILCYYSEDIYPLIAAANELGIETIEMQHGPQNKLHLSYGSWSVVPKEGYDILPRTFWCWDDFSKNEIKSWTKNNTLYNVIVTGNPWVNYWKEKNNNYIYKNYVLYSLQPEPIPYNVLFTPIIIKTIKNSSKTWFIRLHPRQLNDIGKIKKTLKENNILHLVNIDNATQDPLPQLLLNCCVHITHSSGSTLEANCFNIKTILINKMGLLYYPHLIKNGSAKFVNYETKNFDEQINKLIDILPSWE
ncbi:hypothetical protein [Lacinutrix mariniflava]|uniref:hypothetical protein n=1 Tax=Lacinutrix mariniflava TaxID=342955 RepID=UPI0006E3135F|nr:hypothetical protein [Lacinutrix mariniflava]